MIITWSLHNSWSLGIKQFGMLFLAAKYTFFMAEMMAILFLDKAVSLALTMAVEIVVAWVALAIAELCKISKNVR